MTVKEIMAELEAKGNAGVHVVIVGFANFDTNEKRLFEDIFRVQVDIVSVHRPGPFLYNNNISLCGIPHTYHDTYFKDMKYFSDSGGRNVLPHVYEYLAGYRSQGLQLLIHPIWWVGNGKNPTETIDFWLNKNSQFLASEIRLNCKTYKG
jgi:hypothetical protein